MSEKTMLAMPMTPAELSKFSKLEASVKTNIQAFYAVGSYLLVIRDERLYRAEFKSFEEYCSERWGFERIRAHQMIDGAKVMSGLTAAIGDRISLPVNERQTRALHAVPEEKRAEVWEEAIGKAKKGSSPAASIIEKIAKKFKKVVTRKSAAPSDAGWSKEMLADDKELRDAFAAIEKVYGKPDADGLRNGAVETMKRADVILLSKLSRDQQNQIQNLVMAKHWTPKEALAFLKDMPDDGTTIADLKNYCLGTKGLYYQMTIDGYEISVNLKRSPRNTK